MYNMVIIENPVKRWGHSFGIVIPMDIAKKINLKEGQIIEMEIMGKKGVDAFGRFKKAKAFREEKEAHREFW